MNKILFSSLAAVMLLAPHFAVATVHMHGPNDFQPNSDSMLQEFYEHRQEIRDWVLNGIIWPKEVGRSFFTCAACHIALGTIFQKMDSGSSHEEVKDYVVNLCNSLNIVTPDICEMIVPIYYDPLVFIRENKPERTVYDFCGILLDTSNCGNVDPGLTDWSVNVDTTKPPVEDLPQLPVDHPTTKVLHLTDIHPDIHYHVGSLGECGKPLCCRPDSRDDPDNSSIAAGHWGHFNCDMPVHSMVNLFEAAADEHPEVDFILMGGDLVHHQVWNTSAQDNIDHMDVTANALHAAFPGVQIYPVVGNHEAHPCNMFPTRDLWSVHDLSWMYERLADNYKDHLTTEAFEMFRTVGYYTQLHEPGFRIIALNTNFCYLNNFWLFFNPVDPEGHLQWLSDTLHEAEQAGEMVWLLGHEPPGFDDCFMPWSNQFHRIVNRYENIIKAQFYGHTHNDDFKIFFDEDRPTNSLWVGASSTTHVDLNPGYKVFYADGVTGTNTWEVVDHETWIYDLKKANTDGASVEPTWELEYRFKEAFEMDALRPADLLDLVERMVNNNELFQKFYAYFHKSSEQREPCDTQECKMDYLCALVTADYGDRHCNDLKQLVR